MGLRDECVNDYSQKWGHRPYRSMMFVFVLRRPALSPPSRPCFWLHSQSYALFTPRTDVSQHTTDLYRTDSLTHGLTSFLNVQFLTLKLKYNAFHWQDGF